MERVVFGPVRHDWDHVTDQKLWWEHASVACLAVLIVLLGVYPALLTDMMDPAVQAVVTRVGA
jgi:NADH-quinone oxidoreductase subunit M